MAMLRKLRERIAFWRWYLLEFRPIAGAEDDPPEDDSKDDPPNGDDPPEDDSKDDKVEKGDDDAAKARKHEQWAKKERERANKAEAELKKLRDADKSERDKAIEKAREEATAEVTSKYEKERRADRLETAVTRLSKGIKVGEGDDAKTVRFADEDVLLRIERKLRSEDIDPDDLYDSEGKVNTDTLKGAVAEILGANSHLVVGDGKKPAGDPDSRKGDKATSDLESMSPEDHAERKYGKSK